MTDPRATSPRDLADAGYAAFEEGSALVDLSRKTILRLSGKDPHGMLNAILTNEVPKDEASGVYALLLNPKGRIQADLRVLKSAGDVLVDTEPEGAETAKEILGRYAPFSRVKLEELPDWDILGLYGPRAGELLGGLELAEHACAWIDPGGARVLAAGVEMPVPGYDLLGPADAVSSAREHLAGLGAVPVGLQAYETARIATGIPRFGADITPENFPAEAGVLERAVSFEKGCYPGQETVARMHYRGHPNRTLHRLVVEGPSPAPATEIVQGEKKVGSLTSIAPLPVDGEVFALGYLSRSADARGALHAGDATLRTLA